MLALAAICLALVALLAYRERMAIRERQELYQRIQAPQIAVSEHVRKSRPDRPQRRPIAADDDRAYAERNGEGG